ncbi:MAG TPA: hypothetical protein VLL48_14720, partial [Longimicrobiales bacterium]|nr:hypothetical protein [Longimicrobiales bacterium]
MSRHRFPSIPGGWIVLGVAALVAGAPERAAAQAEPQAADSLELEVSRLQARLDSLGRVVEELREAEDSAEAGDEADPLARLRAAAAEAAGGAGEPGAEEEEEEQPQDFVGRQRSLQALNPEISVNADVFGRLNTDDVGENNFVPREVEFSFQASLDPFSRAKFFVAHHQPGTEIEPFEGLPGGHGEEEEGGHGGEFAIEESYVEWVGLPGSLSVKLGKFFQRFGTLNRWHNHALWFQSRSLPHLAFVGEESLAQTGASIHWLIPVEMGGTYETWFQITRSENGRLFGESGQPSYLGHVNAFWELSESLDLDLGVSGLFGEHAEGALQPFGQRLYNVEGTVTWRPPGRTLYREFVLRGGAMLLDPQVPPAPPPGEEVEFADDAWGGWAWANFKFARQWWMGGRFEWTQNP